MTRKHPRTAPGFTLAEVLIAIGIFAIGMIAVASLFPVGALLQKQTADDILGKQSATNARATLEAIGLTYFDPNTAGNDDLDNYHAASSALYGATTLQFSGVVPINNIDALGSSFYSRYTLAERSYPTTEAEFDERDHYWFFYVRDSSGNPAGPSWQGYVLIVEREDGQTFADVLNGLCFRDPTAAADATGQPAVQDTPYITVDGKTGSWNVINNPSYLGAGVFYHPQAVAVETFTFETVKPMP